MSYLLLACRVLLVGVFAVSLVGKIRGAAAYAGFRRSVAEWRIVPRRWLGAVVALAVAGEAAVVLLLAAPWTVPLGFVAGALLLAAFTAGISVVLRRGRVASCPCFGASSARLGPAHVVRNLVLLAVCVTGTVGVVAGTGPPASVPGAALALVAAATGALVVVRFDDIAALTGQQFGEGGER